jgi:hypothetical protein
MLSRARGLLRTRVGQGLLTSKLHARIANHSRNYAAAFDGQAAFDSRHRQKDETNVTSELSAPTNGLRIRRIPSKETDEERLDRGPLPAEKAQALSEGSQKPQSTLSTKQNPGAKQPVKHRAASGHQVHEKGTKRTKRTKRSEVLVHTPDFMLLGQRKRRFAFGIVTTSRPLDTSLDELVKELPPMESSRSTDYENRVTTLVILLTPGLARYALDKDVPNEVYKRLKVQKRSGAQVHATSAIVDRLPAGSDNQEGSEGMAYMVFRGPPTPNPEDHTLFQEAAQKPGALTFRMPMILSDRAAPVMDYELQLPLSQTVFTTSLVSTLIHRKYDLHVKDNSLRLVSEQKLESQTVQLPGMPDRQAINITTMPLVPLTPFRKINYVMGNIIRKLSSQDSQAPKILSHDKESEPGIAEIENDMPASQELEASVSRYFETLDLQPETVSVWALVTPRALKLPLRPGVIQWHCIDKVLDADEEAITKAWHARSDAATTMAKGTANAIRHLIPQGGRLIKVLSGGGGWGKKAGLLSLDPDVQYSTRELRQDDGWKFDFDGVDDGTEAATEAQKKQALGQIVKEGENIMFLLAPKLENVPTQPPDRSSKASLKSATRLVDFTFGAIPSSIDMIPQQPVPDANAPVIQHYPDHFGMLSEGGMAVTVNTMQGTTGQSKLDVPFGKFALHQYKNLWYPEVQSSAQYVRRRNDHALQSSVDALLPTDSTEQAGKVSQSMHKSVKDSSEQPKMPDLFENFAEFDEMEDSQDPAADHQSESAPKPTDQ